MVFLTNFLNSKFKVLSTFEWQISSCIKLCYRLCKRNRWNLKKTPVNQCLTSFNDGTQTGTSIETKSSTSAVVSCFVRDLEHEIVRFLFGSKISLKTRWRFIGGFVSYLNLSLMQSVTMYFKLTVSFFTNFLIRDPFSLSSIFLSWKYG